MIKNLPQIKPSLVFVGLIIAVIVSALLQIHSASPASALSGSDFKPGHIIDDAVFYNEYAMDTGGIQDFLNSKNPTCDTNGTGQATDKGRGDITRAQYAALQGWHGPPYVCLKDYRQNTPQMAAASGLCEAIPAASRSGAQIINDISKACHISPQVLLILLQKEQSLVLDNWPLNGQYEDATGFGCPDTAPCDPSYGGFFYQVYYAARQFQVYKKNPNNYNYVAGRNNNIYFHPGPYNNAASEWYGRFKTQRDIAYCGSTQVYIENQATAALYIYTPYQPNASALGNLYGTGDLCGSYGNRNFWRLFNDWFGSTVRPWDTAISNRYNQLSNETKTALGNPVGTSGCGLKNNGCYQQYQNGYIVGSSSTGYWESMGGIRWQWGQLGYDNSNLGYPTGSIQQISGGGSYQQYQNGFIVGTESTGYWESTGDLRTRWQQLGFEGGSMGYPTGPIIAANGSYYQAYKNGYLVGSSATGWWESMGPIRDRWGALNYEKGSLGLPTSALTCNQPNSGCKQSFQKGWIYWSSSTGAWQTQGSINYRYNQINTVAGSLGYPVAAEVCGTIKSGGCFQLFQNGYIVGTPVTGWWESVGEIRAKWGTLSYENGIMGYPVGPVSQTTNGGYYQQYQNGYIVGSSASGYWESTGDIRGRWAQLGYETGTIGYPTSAIYRLSTGGYYQQYQNGYIVGSSASGWFESMGPIRTKWADLGYETGVLGYPTSAIVCASGTCTQQYQRGTIQNTGSSTTHTLR